MDGFAQDHPQSMVYWTDEDLPFYYSLAKDVHARQSLVLLGARARPTPTGASCSPGTAYGLISTDTSSLIDPPPPNGTIFDRLAAHEIELARLLHRPARRSAIIPLDRSQKYPENLAPIAAVLHRLRRGNLPAGELRRPRVRPRGRGRRAAGGVAGVRSHGAGRRSTPGRRRGEPAGHPDRRGLRRARSSTRCCARRLAADRCSSGPTTSTAATTTTCRRRRRSSPTTSRRARPGRRPRRLRHLRARGCRRSSSRPTREPHDGLERRLRPHLDPRDDRVQVEPAGLHVPRRQRRHRRELPDTKRRACSIRRR